MDFIIMTNNPRVRDVYGSKYCVLYQDCSFNELLFAFRDKVDKGHRLLTHPLSGSVKPNETPYKSIMISVDRGPIDFESSSLISSAITVATDKKFEKYVERQKTFNKRILEDFQLVDYCVITSAIESARTGL